MDTTSATHEGTPAKRFAAAMQHIMAVPKSEVEKRARKYRKQRRAHRKRQKKT